MTELVVFFVRFGSFLGYITLWHVLSIFVVRFSTFLLYEFETVLLLRDLALFVDVNIFCYGFIVVNQ